MHKQCFLDFEFFNSQEKHPTLVSLAAQCFHNGELKFKRNYWLLNKHERQHAKNFMRTILAEGYVFVSYSFEAEARSLLALWPEEPWYAALKAIDLYLEYRCLLNHNHQYAYGAQLDKTGKVRVTKPPPGKWDRREGDEDEDNSKPNYSLAAACFKLLGKRIDTEHKTKMRDLIISGDLAAIEKNRLAIQAYNESDIAYLPELLSALQEAFRKGGIGEGHWRKAAIWRGDYAIATARMVSLGYPVNKLRIDRFTANIPQIIESSIKDVLANAKEFEPFRWDKKQKKWICNEAKVRAWVKDQGKPYWRKTKTGGFSISKDAFSDWFSSESEGFPGAYCRHLKTKQSLNGFMPGGKKGKFADFLGSDCRVRPYFGIYSSQSSRSQPGAVGFLPLKAKWMRSFIQPVAGRAIVGADYASQEFAIAAIVSQDNEMMAAYKSGDVYLAYGRGSAGLIKPGMSPDEIYKIREKVCKPVVLGMSYDMTAKGLAPRVGCTEKEAEELIKAFWLDYPDYAKWKHETWEEYLTDGELTLPDGWILWGDNVNGKRSVLNFPIQGRGAAIMREAVKRAQRYGLDVIYTLHDALYVEYDSSDFQVITTLTHCMEDAFEYIMRGSGRTVPIRIDAKAWSPDYADMTKFPELETQKVFAKFSEENIEKRGEADYNRYKEFFI